MTRRRRHAGSSFDAVLARARRGEEAAWASLYSAMGPGLHRYLVATGAPSPDDVAAEVWEELARGVSGFAGGEDDFRAWAFATARRRRIDALRRYRRVPFPCADVPDDVAPAVPEPGDVDGAVAFVRNVLSPAQAEAVLLRVVADLNVDQAAAIMGRSAGAVRVLTHRGLQRLGTALAEAGEEGVTECGWPTMVGRHAR